MLLVVHRLKVGFLEIQLLLKYGEMEQNWKPHLLFQTVPGFLMAFLPQLVKSQPSFLWNMISL